MMTPTQKNTDLTKNIRDHSGRKFVLLLATVILLIWAALWIGFRHWKSGYEQRAVIGRRAAERVRPLVDSRPPGVDVWEWEDTVDHAEAMLIAVTGSNLLSANQLRELTDQVDTLVDTTRNDPSRAADDLRSFWDDIARRAGPVADIYGRPRLVRDPKTKIHEDTQDRQIPGP